jgi:hypothetical protein
LWCYSECISTPLSYNISGGSAPISLQSSKWSQKHGGFPRIFTFADARMTPLVPNPRGNYHWPTAILGFRRQFHPPGFWKKPETDCWKFSLILTHPQTFPALN